MTDSFESPLHPIAAQVLDYWRGLHPGPGLLPGRQHLDPAALAAVAPRALPHIWLVDVEEAPRRYRLRLIGTALKRAGNPAEPGQYLDEVDSTGEVSQRLDQVCATGQPAHRRGPPRLPHSEEVRELEVLLLPLAADGRTVNMVLGCTLYIMRDGFVPDAVLYGWGADH